MTGPMNGRAMAALAAALLLATGCGAGSAPAATDAVVLGIESDLAESVTPGNAFGSSVDYAFWTPPTLVDPQTREVVPAAAESIESDDQRVWTIRFRPATFHDGSPVTAQSFADSWNATADPARAQENNVLMASIEGYAAMNPTEGEPTATSLSGVEVLDEHTLRLTLVTPNVLLPSLMAAVAFAPLPPTALTDLDALNTAPIGNGPFRAEAWTPQSQEILLTRFEQYTAGPTARAEQIELRLFADPGAIYNEFEAGTVDVLGVAGAVFSQARSAYPDAIVDARLPALYAIHLPLYDRRFTPEIRKALALSIDRAAIVSGLLDGLGAPASGLLPDDVAGGGALDCPDACGFDPAAARALLEQAGGWDGELVLTTFQDPTNEQILQAVANQWQTNLGITDIRLDIQPFAQVSETLDSRTATGPYLLYTATGYPNLYGLASLLFGTGQAFNFSGVSSPDVDAQLAAAAAAADPETATAITRTASETALAQTPVIPLLHPMAGLLHAPDVTAVVPEFFGFPSLTVLGRDGDAP